MDHLARYTPVESGCWIWSGPANQGGYGVVPKWTGEVVASRLFYRSHKGPIHPLMEVCHRCDTPICVNPAHLFLGTRQDNQFDAVKKGRHGGFKVKGERNGCAVLTEQQVLAAFIDPRTQSAIAAELGVDRTTINLIKNRKKWGWLTQHLLPHKNPMGCPASWT